MQEFVFTVHDNKTRPLGWAATQERDVDSARLRLRPLVREFLGTHALLKWTRPDGWPDGPGEFWITDDVFRQRFQPPVGPGADRPLAFVPPDQWRGPALRQAAAEYRVWSLVRGDEGLWLTNGIHVVNREEYLICPVPHAPDQIITVI